MKTVVGGVINSVCSGCGEDESRRKGVKSAIPRGDIISAFDLYLGSKTGDPAGEGGQVDWLTSEEIIPEERDRHS